MLIPLQTGDFRTRISVYDLEENERMFDSGSERVAFQYEHNYWKLPVAMDDTSVIHTSGTSLLDILLDIVFWSLKPIIYDTDCTE